MQEFKAIAPRFNSLLHTINAGASVDTYEQHCGLGHTRRSPQQNVAATRSQKMDIFYKQILTAGADRDVMNSITAAAEKNMRPILKQYTLEI